MKYRKIFDRNRYEIARGDYGKFSNFGSEIEFSIRNPQIDVEITNRMSKILSSYSSRISFRDLKIQIQRHRFGQSVKFHQKLKFFFYKILIFIRYNKKEGVHLVLQRHSFTARR